MPLVKYFDSLQVSRISACADHNPSRRPPERCRRHATSMHSIQSSYLHWIPGRDLLASCILLTNVTHDGESSHRSQPRACQETMPKHCAVRTKSYNRSADVQDFQNTHTVVLSFRLTRLFCIAVSSPQTAHLVNSERSAEASYVTTNSWWILTWTERTNDDLKATFNQCAH